MARAHLPPPGARAAVSAWSSPRVSEPGPWLRFRSHPCVPRGLLRPVTLPRTVPSGHFSTSCSRDVLSELGARMTDAPGCQGPSNAHSNAAARARLDFIPRARAAPARGPGHGSVSCPGLPPPRACSRSPRTKFCPNRSHFVYNSGSSLTRTMLPTATASGVRRPGKSEVSTHQPNPLAGHQFPGSCH